MGIISFGEAGDGFSAVSKDRLQEWAVREFSVPAMVEVPDSTNLTDAPFTRAAERGR